MLVRMIDGEMYVDRRAVFELLDPRPLEHERAAESDAARGEQHDESSERLCHRDTFCTTVRNPGRLLSARSSGARPALRMFMNRFSTSNQNGAPIETAIAVRIQPSR